MDKRSVSLDLHADIFNAKLGMTPEDEGDLALTKARNAWAMYSSSLEDLHRREAAIRLDPTATEAAKNVTMNTLSNKVFEATADRASNAAKMLLDAEKEIGREIEHGFSNRQLYPVAQEIRQHVKSLTGAKRRELLSKADADTLAAILSAKPFLSGLSDAEASQIRDSAERRLFGEQVRRRERLAMARELLMNGGQLYMKAVLGLSDAKAAQKDTEKAQAAKEAMAL